MPKENPTYKEINGTTRVGDFLRKLGKSDFIREASKMAKEMGLPFLSIIGDLITKNEKIGLQDRSLALKMIEKDIEDEKRISERWSKDMLSDSWLSKNIRPMVLIYSWALLTMMIIFKGDINDAYISLIQALAIVVNGAYFGGREFTKMFKIKKNGNI